MVKKSAHASNIACLLLQPSRLQRKLGYRPDPSVGTSSRDPRDTPIAVGGRMRPSPLFSGLPGNPSIRVEGRPALSATGSTGEELVG